MQPTGHAPQDQEAVVEFLSNPASYGAAIANVERHETHGAIVFLAGAYAYKLKRAVCYPYMDYSTPEKRRVLCEAELAINRRMAPQLYIEVRPLVRDGMAVRFGTSSMEEKATDWVVVMHRFDQSSLLGSMRKRGALDSDTIRKVAEAIADFHNMAEIRKAFGGSDGIAQVVEENVALLRLHKGKPFGAPAVEAYADAARGALASVSALLEQRRQNGFVRRCHGDLHMNNVCIIDGRPVLFDAIEFNEAFSVIDILYDTAFLLMELEHHALHFLANTFFNHYLECTGDYAGLAALPLFLSCRAAIRAHVTATLAAESPERAESLNKDAARFLDDAVGFLEPKTPTLIALGGVSGTGKSTLARGLAPLLGRAPGAVILRSDVLRKALLSADESTRLPESAYSRDVSAQVYALLSRRAEGVLAGGQATIADAVFGTQNEQAQIASVTRSVPFRGLWLEAPQSILEARIASRSSDASDATIAVLCSQLTSVARPKNWLAIDASGSPEEILSRAKMAITASCVDSDKFSLRP